MTGQPAALPSGLPFAIDWLPEPVLGFAGGLTHTDPKVGIAAAGPRSLGDHRHPTVVASAFIGTPELIETARKWLKQAAGGVDGDNEHHPFPGYQPNGPFRSTLRLDGPQRTLRRRDLLDLMGEDVWRWSGFDKLLGLLDKHLHALARLDAPPALVFVALPADLVKRYESVRRRRAGVEIVRNLRASIKATAMQHGLRTQLLRQPTIESSLTQHLGDLEHPADLAWNLFTAVYFKAGGFPWAPAGIPDGTCHVGVTFYRPHGERSAMRTSVAQAFADNGDAFVLRGNRFEWEGKWPHLPAEEAARLTADVLDRYADEMGRPARRVVVHKQSRFFDEERAGFEEALRGVEYDLVALAPSTSVRVMRHGDYPPPRGACVTVHPSTATPSTCRPAARAHSGRPVALVGRRTPWPAVTPGGPRGSPLAPAMPSTTPAAAGAAMLVATGDARDKAITAGLSTGWECQPESACQTHGHTPAATVPPTLPTQRGPGWHALLNWPRSAAPLALAAQRLLDWPLSSLCSVFCSARGVAEVGCHAAYSYSWISPPRTSRRRN